MIPENWPVSCTGSGNLNLEPRALPEGLRHFKSEDDAYHLECFRDQQQDLVTEFDKLVAFYQEAGSRNLAALHYAA